MRHLREAPLILLLLGLLSPARAAEANTPETVSARASVSAAEVSLGEVFHLSIEVEHPPGVQVNLPSSLTLGSAIEEIDRESYLRRTAEGASVRRFELALMAFEVGELELPGIPVTYAVQGSAKEVWTQPIPLHVTSFIGDGEEELRDIAAPVRVHRRDLTLLYVLGGVAGLVLLALFFLLLLRLFGRVSRRKAERIVREREAARPPAAEEALARLEELEASGALDADDLKPAYHELSEIVRDYVGRIFGFPALDLTTEEILDLLRRREEGEAVAARLEDWLIHADSVKFAGYPASAEEARQALYEARLFVDETRPAPPRTPAPEAQRA